MIQHDSASLAPPHAQFLKHLSQPKKKFVEYDPEQRVEAGRHRAAACSLIGGFTIMQELNVWKLFKIETVSRVSEQQRYPQSNDTGRLHIGFSVRLLFIFLLVTQWVCVLFTLLSFS